MNKIIHLCVFLASVIMLPTYALDKTDEENRTGGAIKILNKYQGSWKGWSDGCVNCDQPLASDKKVTKVFAKKKIKTKPKVEESKKQDINKDNQIQPVPKSLRRGYCGCNCEDKSSEGSEETNCPKENNSDTTIKSDRAKDPTSEYKNSRAESEQTVRKKTFNMDVRDKPRSSNKNDTDVKDKKDEKDELEKQEIKNDGATGSDGIDSSEGKTNETANEKSKFSIFSIWGSK